MARAREIALERGLHYVREAIDRNPEDTENLIHLGTLHFLLLAFDPDRALKALSLDKKVSAKKVRWVLLEDVGRTALRDDVPPEVVEEALDQVLS